jgi:dTDP-4-dehydrorhamnose reductase
LAPDPPFSPEKGRVFKVIWVLGATGYIGQAFVRELQSRRLDFCGLSRTTFDYSDRRQLAHRLNKEKPVLVIQAAGFTGRPNVDACETMRAETLLGNLGLTLMVAEACAAAGVRMGYVSSGCIYTGAKFKNASGMWEAREILTGSGLLEFRAGRSGHVAGFKEQDKPNFTFRQNNCSFYSGTKALTEEALELFPDTFLWRLRIPFDERQEARNYLTKIQAYPKVYQNWNSLSHRGDFVKGCLDLWEKGAPGGAYNLTNPGYVSTGEVVAKIQKRLRPNWQPVFWADDIEFYRLGAKAPRSNCILDGERVRQAGVQVRPVEEALEDAISRWDRE